MYRSFLIVALLAGLGGLAFSQNTTDWTQPYEADAGAVDLYHFYDGALGGEQEIVDYAAPYLWGWTHNGTGAAPLHVPSMPGFGECIQLDGIDDRGEFPPDGGGAHNVYSNDLSVEAWINPVNLSGIHRIVHMHGTVSFYSDGSNLVMWLFGNDGGNMWFPATTNNPLTAGEWSHVAGTYHYNGDGTAVAKFYVNGSLEGTQNLSSGALPLGNARNTNWQMLGSTSWGSEYFEGKMDEVRISNVVREYVPLNPPNLTDWTKPFDPDADTVFLFHTELDNGNPQFVVNSGPSQWGAWADPITNDSHGSQRFATEVPSPEFVTSIYSSGNSTSWPRWHALVNDVFAITPLENQLTLEAWIRPDSVQASGDVIQRIISCNNCYFLYLFNNEIEVWLKYSDNTDAAFRTTGANVPAGVWSHLVAQWNGAEQTLSIFMNGQLLGSVEVPDKPNLRTPTNTDWLVMCSPPWNAELFAGYIDEVRISKVARYEDNVTSVSNWDLY
ncbi:MAG: hypothetical protein UZ16_OP3001003398 [Candidatus Hinthialibacteria bacterium OLB16]|nr:MAG: hypothetical protein UZ16_OP3001003398 [Candidatus Hinthialibacteria bacterium OLB16]